MLSWEGTPELERRESLWLDPESEGRRLGSGPLGLREEGWGSGLLGLREEGWESGRLGLREEYKDSGVLSLKRSEVNGQYGWSIWFVI